MTDAPSPGPRDENGVRLCEQCHKKPLPPSLGTKPRIYCGKGCKQRAYEARRTGRAVSAAVEEARQRDAKSRDELQAKSRDRNTKARDFAETSQVSEPPPVPASREPEDAPVAKQLYWGMGLNGLPLGVREE
ncbi:hypothetical protein [Streptomyces sp. NPDC088746]|uniref:hypothetical protein n=1 Tax=Streptomyces sp. NPDC088746 TaxID=3365885 RepID=UPI003800BEF7